MREIKFRGKTYESRRYDELSKWVYGDYVFRDGITRIVIDGRHSEVVQRCTVGQYVGVCDCNGVEIYEGDVVKCCYEMPTMGLFGGAVIQEEEFVDVVEYRGVSFYLGKHHILDTFRPDEMEVIGNIHDNSDLLNTKSE